MSKPIPTEMAVSPYQQVELRERVRHPRDEEEYMSSSDYELTSDDEIEVAHLVHEALRRAENSSDRLTAIHVDRLSADALAASLGTPEEWLDAARWHLKVQMSGRDAGSVAVSVAALHLVLMRIEEIDHGGEPWRGNAA